MNNMFPLFLFKSSGIRIMIFPTEINTLKATDTAKADGASTLYLYTDRYCSVYTVSVYKIKT